MDGPSIAINILNSCEELKKLADRLIELLVTTLSVRQKDNNGKLGQGEIRGAKFECHFGYHYAYVGENIS